MSNSKRWLIAGGIALGLFGCIVPLTVVNFVTITLFTLGECRANSAYLIYGLGLVSALAILGGAVAAPLLFGLDKPRAWWLGALAVVALGVVGIVVWFNWASQVC